MNTNIDLEGSNISQEEIEDTQHGKYLTFPLGEEEYGIEISAVTEIIGVQKITVLPDLPHFVKGTINLRGKIIPVIDVRLRFKLEEREYQERTCIIVVNIDDISIGLIVDSVSEVIDISNDSIETPPKLNNGAGNKFVKAFGKVKDNVVIILDIKNLPYEEEEQQRSSTE